MFKDNKGNIYYIKDDRLYVDIAERAFTRLIGRLTYNMKTKTTNLIVQRRSIEKTKLGFLLSYYPLVHLKINKIILIVDSHKMYIIDWFQNKERMRNWVYRPNNFEDQVILRDVDMTYLGELQDQSIS